MAMTDYEAALKHRYRVEPGGPSVPGVTTVINILDKGGLKWAASGIAADTLVYATPEEKADAIAEHRTRLAGARGQSASAIAKRAIAEASDDAVLAHWARGEFDRQWRAKADRGTRVHDVAEAWTKGEEVEVAEEDAGFVDSLEAFHQLYRPGFIRVECIVLHHELAYGGRFDAIATLDGPDAQGTFLLDYKTGGEWPWECAMQAEGYRRGKLATYDEAGSLGELVDLPEVDGCRTVYLREDGTVKVSDPFAHIDRADAWAAFTAALQLFTINKRVEKALATQEKETA